MGQHCGQASDALLRELHDVRGELANSFRRLFERQRLINLGAVYKLRALSTTPPVGARVSVLGAGFTPNDVVYFDNNPTRTVFESPSSISFFGHGARQCGLDPPSTTSTAMSMT